MTAFYLICSLIVAALFIVLIVGTITAALDMNGKDFRVVETIDNKFSIYCKTYIGRWVPLFDVLKKDRNDTSVYLIKQGTTRVDEVRIEEYYADQASAVNVLEDLLEKLRESNRRKKGDDKRIIKDFRV